MLQTAARHLVRRAGKACWLQMLDTGKFHTFVLGVLQYRNCCNWPRCFHFCAFVDIRILRLWFLQLQLTVGGLISEMCGPDVSWSFVVPVPQPILAAEMLLMTTNAVTNDLNSGSRTFLHSRECHPKSDVSWLFLVFFGT